MTYTKRIDWEKLRELCARLYMARGIPEEDAYMVSDNLISAELNGVHSHGVTRMKMYMRYIDNGQINTSGEIKILDEGPATVHVDGNNCLGAVVATKAVKKGIKKAKEAGAAVVSVCHSNHFGTAAYYTQMIAHRGMVGIASTNAFPHVAPYGSYKGYLGTNPISFGVPTASGKPMVLDMSTSIVARGKIAVAAQKDEAIPIGWALDADGKPTTDATTAIQGVLLPIAGPKGYGLSLFIEVLSGVLSGAKYGTQLGKSVSEDVSKATDVGHFFIVIDIARFMPLKQFNERMGVLISDIKSLPKVEGVSEIFMPGEIEQRKVDTNMEKGLQLNRALIEELMEMCDRFDVEFNLL